MRWSHAAISQVPRDTIGVYAFWRRDNRKCIYVGQAKDRPIRDRLLDHWRGSHNEALNSWIRAFGAHLDVCYMVAQYDKIDNFGASTDQGMETGNQHTAQPIDGRATRGTMP